MEIPNLKKWVCVCVASLFINVSTLIAATLTVPSPLYPTIQSAINSASDGDTVLVAPGTYEETIDFLGKEITVESSGGASVTTIDANQLDTVVYFWNGETEESILDGFTLTGGIGYFEPWYEQRLGGAIFVYQSYPTIRNCTLVNNSTDSYGGAVYAGLAYIDSVSFENCTFANNESLRGGAIYAGRTNLVLTNCSLINNTAQFGGAIEATDSGTSITQLAMTNCLIDGNIATQGGGMRLSQKGVSQITNCVINNNEATIAGYAGGGCIVESQHNFINCTFTNNNAVNGNGGAVSIASYAGASPSFTGCEFSNNIAQYGGAIYASNGCTSEITGCDIRENFANVRGGGINVEGCAIIINACSIIGNWTALNINETWHDGGGIWLGGTPSPTIANSLIAGNTAVTGGGISSVNSDVVIANTTIFANNSLTRGGGIYARTKSGSSQFHNSIAWGNSDSLGAGEVSQLFLNDGESLGEIDISYSIVEHWSGNFGGIGNSGIDPRWVNSLGLDGIAGTTDDDLRLQPTSPCIDAGNNFKIYGALDIDGDNRLLDDPYTDDTGIGTPPIVDIGPHEYVVAGVGDSGPRIWVDESSNGCLFNEALNWLPMESPQSTNLAMVDVLFDTSMCLEQDETVAQLIIASGDVEVDLAGMTFTSLNPILVAPYIGEVANLSFTGGTARGVSQLIVDFIDVGNGGSVQLDNSIALTADEMLIQAGAALQGESTLTSEVKNFGGSIQPGTEDKFGQDYGSIIIDGVFSQVGSPTLGTLPRWGTLAFDIGGYSPSESHDYLEILKDASIGGNCKLEFDLSFTPQVGATFDVLTAPSSTGIFGMLWMQGLPANRAALLTDQLGFAGETGDVEIFEAIPIQFEEGDLLSINQGGVITDLLVTDLQNSGNTDVIISRIGDDIDSEGVVEIYFNINNGITSMVSVDVGLRPQGLVSADFDMDGDEDIAVANTDSNTVSILQNIGLDFVEAMIINVSNGPVDLAVGDFLPESSLIDIIVASPSSNALDALKNNSSFVGVGFSNEGSVNSGGPTKVNPGDVNNDKDLDIIALSRDQGSTYVHGEGGFGNNPLNSMPVTIDSIQVPTGDGPRELVVIDINSDNTLDTVVINSDFTVSIRLGLSDVAATIDVGVDVRGLAASDFDNDGDIDLVLASDDVLIVRNDSENLNTLTLSEISNTGMSGIVDSFIATRDVNQDGLDDIVGIVQIDDTQSIQYWTQVEFEILCVGDINTSGIVDVDDLLLLISAWGSNAPDADINDDGIVDVLDVLLLIAHWGPC